MSEKDVEFDPYHKWLGIPREQRPVTCYQLLGIAPNESDTEVIEDAATRQSTHVRTYQLGTHADVCQRILNEISQAKTTLLNPEKRKEYDAKLARAAAPAPRAAPAKLAADRHTARERTTARKAPQKSNTGLVVGMAAGGVVALAALIGGAVWMTQPDPAPSPGPKKGDHAGDRPKPVPAAIAEKKSSVPVVVELPKSVDPKKTPESKRDTAVSVPAKAIGSLAVEERSWRNGLPRIARLMGKDDGIALFGGATGSFNGWLERVLVTPNEKDDWTLEGFAIAALEGYANCVTGLPAGWFDVKNAVAIECVLPGAPSTRDRKVLCSESEGICWLAGVTGRMGSGEGVRVLREGGNWLLEVESGGGEIGAWAVRCPFGKDVDRAQLRMVEVERHPGAGPLKLLDVRDGFCALTAIHGKLQSDQRMAKLSVKDGAWWLECKDAEFDNDMNVRVLCVSLTGRLPTFPGTAATVVKVSVPAFDPKKEASEPAVKRPAAGLAVEQREWRNGMPKIAKVMGTEDGIALFGGATGSFDGWGERFQVTPNNGDWILEAFAFPKLEGYVHCVTGLPAGWFDVKNAIIAGCSVNGNDPKPDRRVLCSESEGICWLAGVTGAMGANEGVRVSREEGNWMLEGVSAGSDIGGWAVAVPFGKGIDRTKLRLSELAWQPIDGPIKLLDVTDGFCVLTEIHGRFQAPTQQVKLTVKEGAWWIEGNDTQGSLRARAMCVSLTGNLPTIPGAIEVALAKSDKTGLAKIEPKRTQPSWTTPQAIPGAEAQAEKQKEVHKRMPPPGPKATAEQSNKFAEAVLTVGLETKDDVPLRFVALREAFEIAYPLGDPDIAGRALQTLEADYVVEPAALKMGALNKALVRANELSAFRPFSDSIDEFVQEAIAADDLDRAEKACALGVLGAQKSKDAGLSSAALKRLSQIRVLAKAYQSCRSAQAILAKTPDDPKACTDVGTYLALAKGDWGEGLKLLAKGSDAKLKSLAQKDLDGPSDAVAREALGDGWADFVQRDSGAYKAKAAERADHWYATILAEAGVLQRLKIEKRMSEIEKFLPTRGPPPTARWTFEVDVRDVVGTMHAKVTRGNPTISQGQLHMTPGDRLHAMLPFDVTDRTLEIWCYLKTTVHTNQHLIAIKQVDKTGQGTTGGHWEGIMFGPTTGKIYPGSSYNHRSRELDIPLETSRPDELLHLAAVYTRDNTITLYRNGKILGQSFRPEGHDFVTYRKGKSAIAIGGNMTIDVEEARFYARALSAAEIATSYRTFKK